MWKHFTSEYLSFSKKERNGTLMLLALIMILVAVPFVFPFFVKKKLYDHHAFEKEIASLNIKLADTARGGYYRKNEDEPAPYLQPTEKNYAAAPSLKGELFYFDPNTLAEAGWQKLGLRDKTINTIKNFLARGGKFYTAKDIHKIWGLSEEEKNRLEPYINIVNTARENKYTTYDKPATVKKTYQASVIDVNTADSTAFISLPGIGSKLSNRIIAFREKLGGFYKIEQVGETFGLADSTFQKIKDRLVLGNAPVKQINLNTATLEELKSHPYIRYAGANAIVQYRNQHGPYHSIDELKKIAIITDELFTKAAPYIKIE